MDESISADYTGEWHDLHGSGRLELEDPRNWENLSAIRSIVSSSEVLKNGFPVFYPGAGKDITYPLGMTDASTFVMVDPAYVREDGSPSAFHSPEQEIKAIHGRVEKITQEGILGKGGKRVIDFTWNNKRRTAVLYAQDATTFRPPEIATGTAMTIIRGVDPAGEKLQDVKSGLPASPDFLLNIYKQLKVGGFISWKPSLGIDPNEIGFKKVIEAGKDERGIPTGYSLYQKVKETENLTQAFTKDFLSYYREHAEEIVDS